MWGKALEEQGTEKTFIQVVQERFPILEMGRRANAGDGEGENVCRASKRSKPQVEMAKVGNARWWGWFKKQKRTFFLASGCLGRWGNNNRVNGKWKK